MSCALIGMPVYSYISASHWSSRAPTLLYIRSKAHRKWDSEGRSPTSDGPDWVHPVFWLPWETIRWPSRGSGDRLNCFIHQTFSGSRNWFFWLMRDKCWQLQSEELCRQVRSCEIWCADDRWLCSLLPFGMWSCAVCWTGALNFRTWCILQCCQYCTGHEGIKGGVEV